MPSIYEHVTAEVIKALESGVAPWVRPWSQDGKASSPWGLPYNAARGSEYRGANVLVLWSVAKQYGYESHAWLTLKQANALGGKVRKGERATWVHFYLWRQDPKDPEKRYPTLKAYRVFNVAQCEGLPESIAVRTDYQELTQGAIEQRVRALGVKVRLGGNKAYYHTSEDRIAVPLPGQFKTREAFYSTLMHECTHATGAKHRLDRNLRGHFGDQSYAAEELIAEMGAAFCMARFGRSLDGLQHPEYLASWLKVLRSDSRAILRAASAAQKACDFIMGDDDGEEVAPVIVPDADPVYPVPCSEPAPVVVVAATVTDDDRALAAFYACEAARKLVWAGHADQLDTDMACKVAKITGKPNREVAGILCEFGRRLYVAGEAIETQRCTDRLVARLARPKATRKAKANALPAGWHRHPVTGHPMRYNGQDIRDAIPYGHDKAMLARVAKHYATHGRIGAANVLAHLDETGQDASQYRAGLMSRRRESGAIRYSYGPARIDPSVVLETNQGMGRVRFRDESASVVGA